MITLTEAAAERIRDIFREQNSDGAALRVFVKSGENGSPQYGMAIEPEPTKTDEIVEAFGVRVAIDEDSLPWVIGSEIDYIESVMTSGFTIRNPNLTGGCSCGGACGAGAQGDTGACQCGGAHGEEGACACGGAHGHH